jgi:hypothetical protein
MGNRSVSLVTPTHRAGAGLAPRFIGWPAM